MTERADPPWLSDLLDALGWQGGTVHQAIAEVRRIASNRTAVSQLTELFEAAHRFREEPMVLRRSFVFRSEPLMIVAGCGAGAVTLTSLLQTACYEDPRSAEVDT